MTGFLAKRFLGKTGRGLASGAVVALMAASGGMMAQAQPVAGAAAERGFAIPGQSLDGALAAFSAATRIQVVVKGELTRGVASPGVSGSLPAEEALRRLLAGTRLTHRFLNADTVTLEPLPAVSGALTLDPVTVEGTRARETAWGPVQGYVATQSESATKTGTPLLETPQAVSIITRDQMDAQAGQTLTEVLRYTSGVNVQAFGVDHRYDWLSIRGFEAFDYRDGLGVPSFQGKVEPYGLERVEVLKGPSSVLYGQISPGGLVNLVSKRPMAEARREVQVDAGTFARREVKADMTGPLDGEGRWLYRIVGLERRSGTQVDHTPDNRTYVAPSLTWRPGDDTTVTLLGEYRRDETRYPQGFDVAGTLRPGVHGRIPTDTYLGEPGRDTYERTQYSVGYILDHRFNEVWSVHQSARHSHYDYDLVGTNSIGFQADGRTQDRIVWTGYPDGNADTIDSRVQARFATGPVGHDVLLGLDHSRSRIASHGTLGMSTPIDAYAPVYGLAGAIPADNDNTVDRLRQTGLYVQDQLRFADRWIVTLGGRHDWARTESENRIAGTTTRQDDTAFTGRAGLTYLFDNGVAPYASLSTSFRPVSGGDFFGTAFEPAKGRQAEIGVKFQPHGINSFITASLFTLTQQNVTTTDPDPNHPNAQVQTGEVRSRGLEIEGTASLGNGLNLSGAYTYLDAEITRSNSGDEGFRPKGIPRHMASLWADYTVSGGSLARLGLAGLGLGGGVRYVGSSLDNTNTLTTPGYTLFDATVHYDLEQVRLAVTARNLTDKTYIANCAWGTCYYGDRRTVVGSVRYRW